MSVTRSILFDEVCLRGNIRDADVAKLRWLYYQDGVITRQEAEALFEIHDACRVQDPAWQSFLVEAITDYLVTHAEPHGYINVANADWLIERIAAQGAIKTATGLELLINVLDKARWAPQSLSCLALNTMKDAILSGNDALRGSVGGAPGVITNADVERLRRIVHAFASEGNIQVTRGELALLFELDAATASETDNPVWTDFFVKAAANVLMGSSGYKVPPPPGSPAPPAVARVPLHADAQPRHRRYADKRAAGPA